MATSAGMKEKGWLEFKYRATGEPIRFPVGTVHGVTDGPTLLVLGGCTAVNLRVSRRLFAYITR
jgi:hypothetical protein